jgi:hypothetical protein
MNVHSWLFSGFIATLLLTGSLAGAQGLGLTRINLPYVLGTMVTANRDRARVYGIGIHLLIGWVFSLCYVVVFHQLGIWNWWRGAIIGIVHALLVLLLGVAALPGLHPRMASEYSGPTAQRTLEPPGFLGLHYGIQTPLSVVLSHALFGAVLGALYRAV